MKVRSESGRVYEIVDKASTPMPNSYIAVIWGIMEFARAEVFDPSYSQLTKLTGVNTRTIQRAVVSLEQRAHLEVIERFSSSGHQISHRYRISESGVRVAAIAGKLGSLVEVSATGMLTEQPIVLQKASAGCLPPNDVDVDVEKQLLLTSKLTGGEPAMARNMLAHIPIDQAQMIADELRGRMAMGGIKNPLGYLAKMILAYDEGNFKPIMAGKGAEARTAPNQRFSNDKS